MQHTITENRLTINEQIATNNEQQANEQRTANTNPAEFSCQCRGVGFWVYLIFTVFAGHSSTNYQSVARLNVIYAASG